MVSMLQPGMLVQQNLEDNPLWCVLRVFGNTAEVAVPMEARDLKLPRTTDAAPIENDNNCFVQDNIQLHDDKWLAMLDRDVSKLSQPEQSPRWSLQPLAATKQIAE